jgi:hypothetical protein
VVPKGPPKTAGCLLDPGPPRQPDDIEKDIYRNIDTLQTIRSFRRTMEIANLVLAGYKSFGPVEVGPVNTFYSFNPVEGFRLRVGGRTTPDLSKRVYFETYAAYGFTDRRWKYFWPLRIRSTTNPSTRFRSISCGPASSGIPKSRPGTPVRAGGQLPAFLQTGRQRQVALQ